MLERKFSAYLSQVVRFSKFVRSYVRYIEVSTKKLLPSEWYEDRFRKEHEGEINYDLTQVENELRETRPDFLKRKISL